MDCSWFFQFYAHSSLMCRLLGGCTPLIWIEKAREGEGERDSIGCRCCGRNKRSQARLWQLHTSPVLSNEPSYFQSTTCKAVELCKHQLPSEKILIQLQSHNFYYKHDDICKKRKKKYYSLCHLTLYHRTWLYLNEGEVVEVETSSGAD